MIENREVKIGVTNRIQAEVISGLTEGELVVTGVQQMVNKAPADNARPLGPRMMR